MGLHEGIFYPDSKPMVTATARGKIKTRCTPLSQMRAEPETALWGRIVWEGLGRAPWPVLGPRAGRQSPASPACAGQERAARGALARQAASPGARARPRLTRKDIFN